MTANSLAIDQFNVSRCDSFDFKIFARHVVDVILRLGNQQKSPFGTA